MWTKALWNKTLEGKKNCDPRFPALITNLFDKSVQIASENFHPLVPTGEASRS